MGSSRSPQGCRRNLAPSSCVIRGWSPRVSRLLGTTHEAQYRIVCEKNLVARQMRGVRSAAESFQCRFRHHEESMPFEVCQLYSSCFIEGYLILKKGYPVLTRMAECSALAISLSCSNLGLLPRISGSQNWPTAPFMCWILP